MINASIILVSFNMGYHIEKTIFSLLTQSESNFELIIINDGSTDNTKEKLRGIKDKRIRLISNNRNSGISASRNKGIKNSRSEYIFFIDADCIAAKDWLKNGLDYFKKEDCAGIEGKITYVSKKYQATYSDRIVQNLYEGEYMTANMAYKNEILKKIGLFHPDFKRNGDRDIAFRVKKYEKIIFCPRMHVFHSASKWKPSEYLKSASWVHYRVVLMFKKSEDKYNMLFRVYAPEKLLSIMFPPIVLLKLFMDTFKTKEDYVLLFLVYPRLVYERLILWKSCIKEGVFIL